VTYTDQMRDHQSRCKTQLLRLRMLARCEADTAVWQQVAEIRNATNVVIAEVEAMSRAILGTDGRRGPEAGTFLGVRISRLAMAADHAIDAARGGDALKLRAHLHRFETLASAIWTVQDALYGQEPAQRPSPGRDNIRRLSAPEDIAQPR
jgi:hypothetical protein